MAIAVMGGLVTSTLLTLFIIPLAYVVLDVVQTRTGRVFAPVAAWVGGVLAPLTNRISPQKNSIKSRIGNEPPSEPAALSVREPEDR
jgi:hypothetical protein